MKLAIKSSLRDACRRRPRQTASTQWQHQLACPLLRLPAELRNHIYGLVLVGPDTIALRLNSLKQPALTATCRQIQDEALPIFTWENSFVLTVTMNNRGIYSVPTANGTRSWTKRTSTFASFHIIEFRSRITASSLESVHGQSITMTFESNGKPTFRQQRIDHEANVYSAGEKYCERKFQSAAELLDEIAMRQREQGIAGVVEMGHAIRRCMSIRIVQFAWLTLGGNFMWRCAQLIDEFQWMEDLAGKIEKKWPEWFEEGDDEADESEGTGSTKNKEPEVMKTVVEYDPTMVLSNC